MVVFEWYGQWMQLVLALARSVPTPFAIWTTVPMVLIGMFLPLAVAFYVLITPWMLSGTISRWHKRRRGQGI